MEKEILWIILQTVSVILIIFSILAGIWMFFKSFESQAEESKTKRYIFGITFLLWLAALISGVFGLSGSYSMEYKNNFILVGVAFIAMLTDTVVFCQYTKSVAKMFICVILAFGCSWIINFLGEKKEDYRIKNSEICTVISTYERKENFIGAPIPSNEMLLPGDKMTEGELYVVLQHEQIYKVHVDSLSSERIIISMNEKPTAEIVLRYETVHFVERSVVDRNEEAGYTKLKQLQPGDTVYLYKGDVIFPKN